MTPGKLHIEYFGSYDFLDFDFKNQGLTLLSGPTGSGKSSLPDALSWMLTGELSKDGPIDEIRSWNADAPTKGYLGVDLPNGGITIFRIRGKTSQNDLYWTESGSDEPIRGKTAVETQRILEARLGGITADYYFTTSYFHQFSKAESFFVSKPTERRELFAKLVDQSLAINLGEKSSEARKVKKKLIELTKLEISNSSGKLTSCQLYLQKSKDSLAKWELANIKAISDLTLKADSFEIDKAKKTADIVSELEQLEPIVVDPVDFDVGEVRIKKEFLKIDKAKRDQQPIRDEISEMKASKAKIDQELSDLIELKQDNCPTCMGPVNNVNRISRLAMLQDDSDALGVLIAESVDQYNKLQIVISTANSLQNQQNDLIKAKHENDKLSLKIDGLHKNLASLDESDNKYLTQIAELKSAVNPYSSQVEDAEKTIEQLNMTINEFNEQLKLSENQLAMLNLLYDLSFDLRGALLSKVIQEIEAETNKQLERHFDAEVKVRFSLESADKLEVEIQKSGNTCSYFRLSGGQRCMLKLAFWVAAKKAAENRSGVTISTVCLDETVRGLDDVLQEKAFGLFQELEQNHETVLIIEHSESIKPLFNNRYEVSITGDVSQITQSGS